MAVSMIGSLFVVLIAGTNCQSTADDEVCTSSDYGLGRLDALVNQQKLIVNKLDAVEAAVNSNQFSRPPLPFQSVGAHVAALKCKSFTCILGCLDLFLAARCRGGRELESIQSTTASISKCRCSRCCTEVQVFYMHI